MNKYAHLLAASGVALSMSVVGCTPTAQFRPTSLASITPAQERDSARLADRVRVAVQAGKLGEALTHAERAVEQSPRDLGHRMLLGDLYLKNGRFASAEASFADVVALDPGNVRGTLSLALSLIAQGKTQLATNALEQIDASASPGDVGLAYALAGRHDRARALLEPAARDPEATGRVRQNLALAYALAGDWQKAKIIAAQDVSPAELNTRLEQWAALANPVDSYAQVASVLGVTPAADPGRPVRLALQAEPAPVALAEAAPPAPIEVTQSAPVIVAAAAPVPVAYVAPSSELTAIVPPAPTPVQLAAATETLLQASPAVVRSANLVTSAPIPAFKPARTVRFASQPRKAATGRYVVQIGAYRNLDQTSRAWDVAARRYGIGADKQPLSTTVTLPGRGTFHRLAVAPFAVPAQAIRACATIRARGGACFVRTLAGDAPLQYAMRAARRGSYKAS